jgi:hypothetical protein
MARVGADDKQLALPADQFAVFANPLDAGTNFHETTLLMETLIVVSSVKPTRGILW